MKKNKKKYFKKNQKKKENKNSLGYGFFIIPLILLVFIFSIVFSITEEKNYVYRSPIFKTYEPLKKTDDVNFEINYIDDVGILYDEETSHYVDDAIKYFYEKTGVKVFVLISPMSVDEEGDEELPSRSEALETCEKIQNKLSDDGVDLVLLYVPIRGGYKTWSYATDEVRDRYGSKCEALLKQTIDYNFNVVGEYYELFWKSFEQSADRLMGGFTSPVVLIKENIRVVILGICTLVVLGSSVLFYRKIGK